MSLAATMAVGQCCLPDCKIRSRAERALEDGLPLPDYSGVFVTVEHSKRGGECCNVMHQECFDDVTPRLADRIRRHSTTVSEHEIYKTMFDDTRSGKYDMIRKQCVCACGGLFRVSMNQRGTPIVSECTVVKSAPLHTEAAVRTAEKKKKNKTRSAGLKPITLEKLKALELDDDDEVDDELSAYLWIPPTQLDDVPVETAPAVYDLRDFEHELPFTASLPMPLNWSKASTKLQPPSVVIHPGPSFHMITVSRDNMKVWRSAFIGRGGTNIKQLESYNRCKVSMSDFHGGVRITVTGRQDDRETCCIVARDRILNRF